MNKKDLQYRVLELENIVFHLRTLLDLDEPKKKYYADWVDDNWGGRYWAFKEDRRVSCCSLYSIGRRSTDPGVPCKPDRRGSSQGRREAALSRRRVNRRSTD